MIPGRVVLFTDLRCDKCKDAEQALLEASTEQQPIPAQVCPWSPLHFKAICASRT